MSETLSPTSHHAHSRRYDSLQRISAPLAEAISLAEAKLYLRVDHMQDDLYISELIVAVRMFAEDYLSRSLVMQDWAVSYSEAFTTFRLPMAPVQQVSAIMVTHGDSTTLLDQADYTFVQPDLLTLKAGGYGRVRISYRTGSDALNVSYPLKQTMFSHIALCYDRRGEGAVDALPAHALYDPYKEVRV